MARFLTLAAIAIVFNIVSADELNNTVALNALRDPKHRSELVDEAFLEQKDVLLEMLEAKLKEVKDKKKKKKILEKSDLKFNDQKLCDPLSKEKSLVMRANGISNVGVVNLLMNHGASGKGHLNLDADGISNVGRAHLELGMEGGVNIPGVSNSLIAAPLLFNSILCNNLEPKDAKTILNSPDAPKEINLDVTSLRKTDVNNSIIDANSTKLDANTTNAVANATTPAVNYTNTTANTTNIAANAISTTVYSIPINTTTVDSNDIDVSNITASTSDATTTVASSSTDGAGANNITAMNNLNTVSK